MAVSPHHFTLKKNEMMRSRIEITIPPNWNASKLSIENFVANPVTCNKSRIVIEPIITMKETF